MDYRRYKSAWNFRGGSKDKNFASLHHVWTYNTGLTWKCSPVLTHKNPKSKFFRGNLCIIPRNFRVSWALNQHFQRFPEGRWTEIHCTFLEGPILPSTRSAFAEQGTQFFRHERGRPTFPSLNRPMCRYMGCTHCGMLLGECSSLYC